MPLRKLKIEIDLPTTATGQRAKEEQARLVQGLLQLITDPRWSAFTMPLYDSLGNHVGHASLSRGTRPSDTKELPSGERQQAAA